MQRLPIRCGGGDDTVVAIDLLLETDMKLPARVQFTRTPSVRPSFPSFAVRSLLVVLVRFFFSPVVRYPANPLADVQLADL